MYNRGSDNSRSYNAIISKIGKFVALIRAQRRKMCSKVDDHKPDHEDIDLDPIQVANSKTWIPGLTLWNHLGDST